MPNPGPRSVAPRSPWLLPPAASVPWSCWEIHLGEHASAALRKSPERDTATPTASRLRLLPSPADAPGADSSLPSSPPAAAWPLHLYEAQQYVQTQSCPALLPPRNQCS